MREPRGRVYLTGPFDFPWGSASARRVVGVARSCARAGYDVHVASASPDPTTTSRLDTPGDEGTVTFAGLDEFPTGGRPRHAYGWLWGMGRAAVRDLDARPERPTHVILYGGTLPYLRHLLPWCRAHRVPLLLDLVEWYDPRALPGGRWGPIAAAEGLARRLHSRAAGAIAISTLLEEALHRRGVAHVALMPPTVDLAASVPGAGSGRTGIVCGYAGTPGRKDELGLIVGAVAAAREVGADVTLEVIGPDTAEVAGLTDGPGLPPGIVVVGRLPQQDVAARVGSWDYTVLMREDKRSSHAGFPTKLVESLVAGTPVIANLTSDLGDHLVDGENGYVVPQVDRAALVHVLVRAAEADPAGRVAMRDRARATARRFDYREFAGLVRRLLDQTRGPDLRSRP